MDTLPTIGLILAGGRSRRMGTDKAFAPLAGQPLLAHVIERLAPQVNELVISSNAPGANFAAFGTPVLPDVLDGFHGPLAGVHAALARFPEAAVVSVAVDLPLLPRDLVARLKAGWDGTRCRYAVCGDRHALAILWPPGFTDALWSCLVQGRRGVSDWLERRGEPVPVPRATMPISVLTSTPLPSSRRQRGLWRTRADKRACLRVRPGAPGLYNARSLAAGDNDGRRAQ